MLAYPQLWEKPLFFRYFSSGCRDFSPGVEYYTIENTITTRMPMKIGEAVFYEAYQEGVG